MMRDLAGDWRFGQSPVPVHRAVGDLDVPFFAILTWGFGGVLARPPLSLLFGCWSRGGVVGRSRRRRRRRDPGADSRFCGSELGGLLHGPAFSNAHGLGGRGGPEMVPALPNAKD